MTLLIAVVSSYPFLWQPAMPENRSIRLYPQVQRAGMFHVAGFNEREKKSKRSRCLINAGLSQGCDMSDIIFANQQANKFSSFAGPGK
ncbi:hypothetical protein L596_022150 [Steinernema carpocapsae]|uniref:Uncharacterized protein n=1 Tax=Steinernema carpocapsae TaxID=34508 RepID=A0A4U5ML90_STECR|nr:hypothetical protein L596_022150 [Steinernema carpocapsae]